MILDPIVSSSRQILGNNGPFVSKKKMRTHENLVLKLAPLFLFDVWVEMIVPPFPALFAFSVVEVLRHLGPSSGSILRDKLHQKTVLFLGPISLGKILLFLDFFKRIFQLIFHAEIWLKKLLMLFWKVSENAVLLVKALVGFQSRKEKLLILKRRVLELMRDVFD